MSPADTVAFLDKPLDRRWDFYLHRPRIPVFTLADIRESFQAPAVIIAGYKKARIDLLIEKYSYEKAFVKKIGSQKYVILKHIKTVAEPADGPVIPQFSFAILADPRMHEDSWENALLQIRNMSTTPPPIFDAAEFIVVVGDMDPLTERYRDFKQVFAGTRPPEFLPVIGNHDLNQVDQNYLFAQHTVIPVISNAVRRHPDACDYYFDNRNTRIIVLDAYSELGDNGVITARGRQWVAQVIEAAPGSIEHIFVCFHEPAFPRYRHITQSFDADPENRNAFWDMLVAHKSKVRAVFVGHTHHYYRMRIVNPRSPEASDPAVFPNESGGVYQIDAGAAGHGSKNTVIQVQIDGAVVYFRVLQADNGKARSFRVIDEWKIDADIDSTAIAAVKTGQGS